MKKSTYIISNLLVIVIAYGFTKGPIGHYYNKYVVMPATQKLLDLKNLHDFIKLMKEENKIKTSLYDPILNLPKNKVLKFDFGNCGYEFQSLADGTLRITRNEIGKEPSTVVLSEELKKKVFAKSTGIQKAGNDYFGVSTPPITPSFMGIVPSAEQSLNR